jgi:hypothetical protein
VIRVRSPVAFPLGQVVATRSALAAIREAGQSPTLFVLRHAGGDWGDVCGDDWAMNDEALESEGRLHSSYRTTLGARVWVITETDRSITTILLPDEY